MSTRQDVLVCSTLENIEKYKEECNAFCKTKNLKIKNTLTLKEYLSLDEYQIILKKNNLNILIVIIADSKGGGFLLLNRDGENTFKKFKEPTSKYSNVQISLGYTVIYCVIWLLCLDSRSTEVFFYSFILSGGYLFLHLYNFFTKGKILFEADLTAFLIILPLYFLFYWYSSGQLLVIPYLQAYTMAHISAIIFLFVMETAFELHP